MICSSLKLAVLCAAAAMGAWAAPITWNVNGTFTDGGVLSGSFTFDADTNTIPTWSISVSGGNTAVFPDLTYVTGIIPAGFNNFLAPEEQFIFYDPNSTRLLILSSVAPLTNAGGSIGMLGFVDNTNFSGECYNCNPTRFLVRGGSFVSAATDTPEPATWSLMTAGGLFLLLGRRRRTSSPGQLNTQFSALTHNQRLTEPQHADGSVRAGFVFDSGAVQGNPGGA